MLRKSSRYIAAAALAAALFAASSAAAQKMEVLRLALVPERNVFDQEEKYRPLCDYLYNRVGTTVVFEVLKDYEDVMREIEGNRAHGGVLGSFLMAHGMAKHGFVPLVRPVWESGESNYSSYIFKRAGSPATRDVATWKGKSFAFANRSTSAGYFFPMAVLRKNGVLNGEGHFSEVQVTGSHDTAVWMVASGLADIGAAKSTIFDEMVKMRPGLGDRVEMLYTGGRFPDATFMVNPQVPREIRDRLKKALLGISSDPQGKDVLKRFGARGFIPSDPEDYDDVYRVIKSAGIDIDNLSVTSHGREPQP